MSKPIDEVDSLHHTLEAERVEPTYTALKGEHPGKAIPLLDEVAIDDIDATWSHDSDALPAPEELLTLIDTMLDRQLQRLKPVIHELLIEELQAIYPALNLTGTRNDD